MNGFRVLLIIALLLTSVVGYAVDDTPENRREQAQRYILAVPPERMIRLSLDASAREMGLSPAERFQLRSSVMRHIDTEVISETMIASMIKHYTADELAAVADFYSTPVGQSLMEKEAKYYAEIAPTIESEVAGALDKFLRSLR
jgi:hypothetical protein